MAQRTLVKAIRLTHLYYGVFISPAILFFALTGALQTFDLHEPNRAGTYQPPKWLAVLGHLHKKADASMPQQRGPGGGGQGGAGNGAGREKSTDHAAAAPAGVTAGNGAVRSGSSTILPAESSNASDAAARRGADHSRKRGDDAGARQSANAAVAPSSIATSGSPAEVPPGRPIQAADGRGGASTGTTPKRHNTLPMKIFFVVVSLGLFVATGTGLYMSYTYTRNKKLVTLALVAGIVVPLLLTLF